MAVIISSILTQDMMSVLSSVRTFACVYVLAYVCVCVRMCVGVHVLCSTHDLANLPNLSNLLCWTCCPTRQCLFYLTAAAQLRINIVRVSSGHRVFYYSGLVWNIRSGNWTERY